MKNLLEELVDESYKSIKSFTKNNKLTDEEMTELDAFVKNIQSTLSRIEENKNKNLSSNLGKAFKHLIENGIDDVKRDA